MPQSNDQGIFATIHHQLNHQYSAQVSVPSNALILLKCWLRAEKFCKYAILFLEEVLSDHREMTLCSPYCIKQFFDITAYKNR
jgi:hypothetical protein